MLYDFTGHPTFHMGRVLVTRNPSQATTHFLPGGVDSWDDKQKESLSCRVESVAVSVVVIHKVTAAYKLHGSPISFNLSSSYR